MDAWSGILVVVIAILISSTQGAPTLSVDDTPSNYSSSVTLKCSDPDYVSGNGYSWTKNGVTIFNNAGEATTTGKYSGDIDGTILKLIINDLVADDEDSYVCNHAFLDSNALNIEVESRGTVTAKLSSSNELRVTLEQIYPNSTTVDITCGTNTVGVVFESSVADGDRFTNTWKSTNTFSTLPTSCSASVTLWTTFDTAFTVTSAPTVETYDCPGLGNSTAVDSEVKCAGCWFGIGFAILLVVLYLNGIVLGCILKDTTCCCVCFYEGESCRKCAKYKCCYCGCCAPTPCGACCIIGGLPPWYKRLWASAIGIPIAFGIWVVWRYCRQGNNDTSKNAVGTGSNPKNARKKLLDQKKPSKSPGKDDDVKKENPASEKQNQHADQAHKVENEGKKAGRPQPPPPVGANQSSQLPNRHSPGHDKKGRGLSANFGDDDHPLVGVDIPAKKAGTLPTLEDTPREDKKKTKKKKKKSEPEDKKEDSKKTETAIDF